ncbi:hypothetical protein QBC40DRAFT_280462, partial [Triangularia verruculosa]
MAFLILAVLCRLNLGTDINFLGCYFDDLMSHTSSSRCLGRILICSDSCSIPARATRWCGGAFGPSGAFRIHRGLDQSAGSHEFGHNYRRRCRN